MWKWIVGTVRPISLLAGIPVVIGALISRTPIGCDVLYAIVAAMLGVGFANSFNSLIDRHIDRLNPIKKSLATEKPVAAWYGVLFLLPILAFCLRSNSYNHCLFAVMYYISFSYSYSFGRVRILKRVIVAINIALLAFLYAQETNLALWLFVGFASVYFYIRERRKDYDDRKEDNQMRFAWEGWGKLDKWCVSAPFLAVGIYLACLYSADYPIDITESIISFGIAVSVWSYVQIRYRYRHYKMHLSHQTMGGRLGAVIALVGLMPSFVSPAFVLVVLANSFSIVYRSFLRRRFTFERMGVAHDAYLWASLPLLAMLKTGIQPNLIVASVLIGVITYTRESWRLHLVSQSC